MNPYDVLGVRPDASGDEIRRAYLRLARRYHPDYFTDASPAEQAAAEASMRSVNEAWAVVSDDTRRREHDRVGSAGFQPFAPDEEDPDPRDQPDVPYRPPPPATTGRRLTTVAPVLLFAASVAVGALGAVLRLTGLLGVAIGLFLLSCVGFLVLPLFAMSRARQDEG